MLPRIMLLPSRSPRHNLLVRVPEDMEEHEAYRYATGLIADVEEASVEKARDEIIETLEDHGFKPLEYLLGPSLD